MRSLTLKLVLGFLAISLVGAALTAVIIRQTTRNEFNRFVLEQERNRFLASVSAYYENNGSWNGVSNHLRSPAAVLGFPQRQGARMQALTPFLLVDTRGNVLVESGRYHLGDKVPANLLDDGARVEVDGEHVGTVVFVANAPEFDPREREYIESTSRAILLSAAGAALAALLLGVVLARTFSRPLRELSSAADDISRGNYGQQVAVRSQDEIGALSQTFNRMSTALERANRLRKQMVADIAHDLRTPLTVITGYLESLREGVLAPTPQRLEVLHNEALHLARLVEDLRTLSLADAGELNLVREVVHPAELLKKALQSYQLPAENQKIHLVLDVQAGLPALSADEGRLMQMMSNLLSNALQHTPEGGLITLSARLNAGGVELAVRDTGEGIDAQDLPNLFERFYRPEKSRARIDGSGLGLAIARSIVELHGGTIRAESDGPGQGSTFVAFFKVMNADPL